MKKNDIILIVLIVLVYLFLVINTDNKKSDIAFVYYDSDLIKEISLNKNEEYKVMGFNGEVIIEVKDNMIRVKEETSNLNLCSKQGFVGNNGESIVCLPNKIVIELANDDYDSVIE